MKKIPFVVLYGLLSLLMMSACSVTGIPTVHPLPSAIPHTGGKEALPTSISPGQEIKTDHLRVSMKQAEITSSYITEYGLKREPPAGQNILWVNIQIENMGQSETSLPAVEHFSVLYGTSEFKSGYGHRLGSTDYSTLKPVIYQGQKLDAWLRFDIPVDAALSDLQFAFMPGALQIDFSLPSSGYSWADHPVFLWKCAP